MALKKQTSTGQSPTSKIGSTASSTPAAGRKSMTGTSPSKKGTKYGGASSPTKSPMKKTTVTPVAGSLSGILGLMFDKICPNNLATSEGLGADNMTGILIEFNKPKAEEDQQ